LILQYNGNPALKPELYLARFWSISGTLVPQIDRPRPGREGTSPWLESKISRLNLKFTSQSHEGEAVSNVHKFPFLEFSPFSGEAAPLLPPELVRKGRWYNLQGGAGGTKIWFCQLWRDQRRDGSFLDERLIQPLQCAK